MIELPIMKLNPQYTHIINIFDMWLYSIEYMITSC
jgi:hypothetical protein